jgi:hypothetical protein
MSWPSPPPNSATSHQAFDRGLAIRLCQRCPPGHRPEKGANLHSSADAAVMLNVSERTVKTVILVATVGRPDDVRAHRPSSSIEPPHHWGKRKLARDR